MQTSLYTKAENACCITDISSYLTADARDSKGLIKNDEWRGKCNGCMQEHEAAWQMWDWGVQLLLWGDLGAFLLWLSGNSQRYCWGCRPRIRYICIANARDADSAVRHRLMQCKKGLENSKSNYYSCATEVKRRVRLLRAQIPDKWAECL